MIYRYRPKELNDFRVVPWYNLKEFECPCCGRVMIHSTLVSFLSAVRGKWGKPIPINSGYRCPMQNIRVGGKIQSRHIYGEAADIPLGDEELEAAFRYFLTNEELYSRIRVTKESDHYHVYVLP